ncbi:MAG: sulfatase [Akkermansiaceae bacterium]|jgi:arylsulfatase A-like enzyme|nr:sulfatase [Akkermansiaceae bacterium]
MKIIHFRVLLALASLCLAKAAFAAPAKPNFLFVIADDQRWDAIGAVQREQGERARFPWFESPAMDRLAAGGVRFRNAFVVHSICSPGRAAFLTGQHNHINGIRNNSTPFPEAAVTHATLLRDAGYRTAYFGKWHMGGQSGPRPGFQHSASFINQGIYQDCPFEINGATVATKGWVDDVSTNLAVEWLRQHRDAPFSMVVGFKSPHNKRGGDNLPPRLRALYQSETSRPVPNLLASAIYHKPQPETGALPRGLADNAVHLDYFRHIKGIDENLGKLLDALDELNLADDTVVVFTSDNGYFLGEHGLGDKRALYEESLRIPFLVRYPRQFPKGRVVDEIVLNIDLAPTFLDLAGVKVPNAMQGASWKPLARGEAPTDWRTSFLAYYFKELGDTPTCYGVRTTTAKLVLYPGKPEWTEAFDLAKDPYETRNLAADTAFTTPLRAELDQLMTRYQFTPPKPAAAR